MIAMNSSRALQVPSGGNVHLCRCSSPLELKTPDRSTTSVRPGAFPMRIVDHPHHRTFSSCISRPCQTSIEPPSFPMRKEGKRKAVLPGGTSLQLLIGAQHLAQPISRRTTIFFETSWCATGKDGSWEGKARRARCCVGGKYDGRMGIGWWFI